ncbi:HD domain-containing protein (plasmid) [Candidatus Megaera polyxenophila]|uniref:HD domain-containing protein n=1 Tax=Candidatus Megaera polyxenophila TaxID=988779 RepID=UPI00249E1CD0|nr:HD domain-containing protein [Candidatus Megaera polyxenophila]
MDYSAPCKYSIRLIEKLKSLDTKNILNFDLVNKAIYWARKYHGVQVRKSGEPFYSHPLEVAYMISDYKLKTDVIVASILHDIVEDTEVTVEMINSSFGQRIAEMVDRLSRDRPDGTKLSVEEIITNAYQMQDEEVLLIKLMDRTHNISTLNFMSVEKQKLQINESIRNFLIFAEDLSLHDISEYIYKECVNLNIKLKVVSLSDLQYREPIFDKEFSLPALVNQND